jgi:hypothetical protein
MGKILNTFAKASIGSRLAFLLAFLAVVVVQGIWHYHRFHFSAPFWLMVLWSLPWLEWALPLGNLVPSHLRAPAYVILMASGFAINTTLAYILVRAVWFSWQRSNNSFKPKPLRGSA